MFDRSIVDAMKRHAGEEFPQECCGLVIDMEGGEYLRCKNISESPNKAFKIADAMIDQYYDCLVCVVHSHPAPFFAAPSGADMQCQIDMDVIFGIVPVGEDGDAAEPFFWGGQAPIPALEGRQYRHGITDCYSVIRDWYRLNKEVVLPDQARDHRWYANREDNQDFYLAGYQSAGFVDIDFTESDIGDVLLMQVGSDVISHAGVITEPGLMLHHPGGEKAYDPSKLSRVEPVARWQQYVKRVVRYAG